MPKNLPAAVAAKAATVAIMNFILAVLGWVDIRLESEVSDQG